MVSTGHLKIHLDLQPGPELRPIARCRGLTKMGASTREWVTRTRWQNGSQRLSARGCRYPVAEPAAPLVGQDAAVGLNDADIVLIAREKCRVDAQSPDHEQRGGEHGSCMPPVSCGRADVHPAQVRVAAYPPQRGLRDHARPPGMLLPLARCAEAALNAFGIVFDGCLGASPK
jgi:hypothetical protein